jgi:hypothetical protein
MAVISKIRVEDVIGAIALLDDPVEGPRLREELGFKSAKNYRLLWEGRFYDSKPVVGIANGLLTGTYIDHEGFSGGAKRVASLLTRLGFVVDDGWLYEIKQLRVSWPQGKRAPYQYVVLLWALSRAVRSEGPRMVPFSSVRDELSELLAPFAISETPPDPAMPWLALRGPLWDLEVPDGVTISGDSDIKRLDTVGGLSSNVYNSVRGDVGALSRWAAAVDVIDRLIGQEPAFESTLRKLRAPGVGRTYSVPDENGQIRLRNTSPEVADAFAAVEEVSNPRRKFGRRFSAVENKAIEERAVRVTRDHLEQHLGYATEDVGATRSYDIHATKGSKVIKVEVKGTTTDGSAVVLTRNEVDLHRAEHPNNALAIVRHLALDHSSEEPVAHGGELVLVMPWKIDEAGLSAIAYDYRTGL